MPRGSHADVFFLPFVADALKRHFPNPKFIFSFRHPVERAYSGWLMRKQLGHEDLDFIDALKANRDQNVDFSGPSFKRSWQEEHNSWRRTKRRNIIRTYIEAGDYATIWSRYVDLFGQESCKKIYTEELHQNLQSSMQEICVFLGVSHFSSRLKDEKVNVFKESKSPTLLLPFKIQFWMPFRRGHLSTSRMHLARWSLNDRKNRRWRLRSVNSLWISLHPWSIRWNNFGRRTSPTGSGEMKEFVVLSGQRSGSTLIVRSLDTSTDIYCAGEILHPLEKSKIHHIEWKHRYIKMGSYKATIFLNGLLWRERIKRHIDQFYRSRNADEIARGFKLMKSQLDYNSSLLPFLIARGWHLSL